ncbi:hypothetical protein OSB04_un000717 [Centaurea solstitialis]|uniref:DUF241 domain protein n=1 Tax=Centaurea solstitialis TaxID=347529 RepID=A0AA38VRK7_9ASTR|nr:hypothetical protein OSB04_un000717 [Centaurea solstitialis]
MASTFSSSENIHHFRSMSLPTISHPSTIQAEEEICKFRTWEASTSSVPTADTICGALNRLQGLYECVDGLLSLPLTQQALTHGQYTRLVNELLDKSISLMDICESTRDLVSQVKENARDIQSAVRRKKGDVSIATSFMKNLKKDTKKAISSLKQIDEKIGGQVPPIDLDHHVLSVIKVVRDVGVVRSSVYRSLLLFLSGSVAKSKSTRWSIVSKMIHKGTAEEKNQVQVFNGDLESLFEEMENGLECMFRSLIKTRASLLNILPPKHSLNLGSTVTMDQA